MTTQSMKPLNLPSNKNTLIYIVLALVLGLTSAFVAYFIDPTFALLGLAGIVFLYILIFHVEVAIILFILVQNQLSQYNYLGNGTPFHPNGLLGVSLIGGAVWLFIFNPIYRARLQGNRVMLGFLILCGLQLIISTITGSAGSHWLDQLNATLRLIAAIAVYLVLIYKLDSVTKVKWVAGAVIAAQILPTINGLLISAGTSGFSFFQYAETARLGNSGVGVYLAMILILCVVFFLNAKQNVWRFILACLTILYTLGLFFSYGRAGWISFVIGLGVIGVLKHRRLLLMLPLLLILAVGNIPAISERFVDLSTFTGRLRIWEAAFGIFINHPIFGIGYGTGRYLVGEYLRQYSQAIHNDYLSVLLDTGVIGFALFIIWHGQWLIALFNHYLKTEFDFDKIFGLAVFAVLLVSLVNRFSDNVLIDTYKMYPLAALIAACLALPRIRAKEALDRAGNEGGS